jgi:hypothetical protein
VTKFEMSRKEREWDPVLSKFRDVNRDSALYTRDSERQAKQRQDARQKQLKIGQRWDIISNEVFTDAPPKPPKLVRPRRPDSLARYNILNNVTLAKHKNVKMVPGPNE